MKTEFNKYVISSYFLQRRIKALLRVFYLFIILTILLTAYLYGLIEIDSQKVVIKIMPSSFNTNNIKMHRENLPGNVHNEDSSNEPSDNDYLSVHKEKKDELESKQNEVKKLKQKQDEILKKNISKFFTHVEKYELQIKSLLRTYEAESLIRVKEKNVDMIIDKQDRLRKKYKEEMKKKMQDENFNSNETTTADSYEDIDLITQLDRADFVSREVLVRLLRLEKYKLKKASEMPRTIKDLLDDFDSKDEFNESDLPAIWNKYFFKISERSLYNNTSILTQVLDGMTTSPVVSCSEKEKGTQIKVLMQLADGTDVLVKPMKTARDYETPPDHFYFVDFERHHAEIAAFHLDKLLGFYRVPPTVGRIFNITSDLWNKAESEFARTFFYSPAGNTCFTGHCSYYCDTTHAICGRPFDRMEGSVQLMLPNKPLVKWKVTSHPYRRTYNKKKKAEWEINQNYCNEKVFQDINYQSKLLLDVMDMAVFDFITGNMDRHHFERMISISNKTFSLHLDNGRSFGRQYQDEMSILAPITQCCVIRYSTFTRLRYLFKNNFSKLLDESLKNDPLYPILTKDHLKAMDRRLEIILSELNKCVQKFIPTQVIVDDGY